MPEEHHQPAPHVGGGAGLGGAGLGGAGLGGPGLGGAGLAGAGTGTGNVGTGGAGAGGSEAFLHLLNNPQFQMVRNLIRQNPQMLQGILIQLQQSNPELFNVSMGV